MIDVHCHLVDTKYQDLGIQSIVDRAKAAGVEMIANGTGMNENRKHLEIAKKNDGVWVCVGMAYDPGVTDQEKNKRELKTLTKHPKVVGIGEAGLNFYQGMSEGLKKYQRRLFEMHLELAAELNLPIQIHNREADEEIRLTIRTFPVKTVLHCFSGTMDFMREMTELGCYFSFGGMITYKKNEALREVVKHIPDDRLLVETDSPYLPPEPLRGTINTPANVKIVTERIAEIRGVAVTDLDNLTSENARRLFKLS